MSENNRRARNKELFLFENRVLTHEQVNTCLLYTSDAADERSSVDLGGRRIIKKKKTTTLRHVVRRTE